MKKIQFTIIIYIIIIICGLTTTFASSQSVQINGANEVVGGEDNIITVQVQNSEAVGVIQGIIKFDSNIKDVKINPSYNGWTATYNEKTGQFNAFNAKGTSNGEVLQITYKLSENAQQGSVTLKDLELTTISYDIKKVENDITKTITKTTKNSNQNENPINKNGITNNKGKNITNINAKQSNIGNTKAKTILPKAGNASFIIIAIITMLIIIVIILYKKMQSYK